MTVHRHRTGDRTARTGSYQLYSVSEVGDTLIDPSALTVEPSSVTASALEVVQRKTVDSPDSIVESSA